MHSIDQLVAMQRPEWPDEKHLQVVSKTLGLRKGLVSIDDVLELRSLVAAASNGTALILQYGDCAEPIMEDPSDYVASFLKLKTALQDAAVAVSSRRIVHIGRIAGQYAKPRSLDRERVFGGDLYSYRGDMVNSIEPVASKRIPDPNRLLWAYDCAQKVVALLTRTCPTPTLKKLEPHFYARTNCRRTENLDVYTSHEALILEYERPLIHTDPVSGLKFSSSAHMLWVGDRTRSLNSAHVDLMKSICNPVGIKVGPDSSFDELVSIIEKINPYNTPGRIILIVRLGAREVFAKLPRLMADLKRRGACVAWICDPMHGNTIKLDDGRKARLFGDITSEIDGFAKVAANEDVLTAGIHLEASQFAIDECIEDFSGIPLHRADMRVASEAAWCDPRLSLQQAANAVKRYASLAG